MRLQSSCSAGKNPQVPAGLALTLLKAPSTRLPAGIGPGPRGSGEGQGCAPEVLASPPGQGRRWAAAGRGRGSAATCFPALRGHAFLPLASAPAPRYPPPRPPLTTSRGPGWETPIALHTPHPHPRRLPLVPGVGLLGRQSRSPPEPGRWVGGAGLGNPIRDLSVPGQVAAPGAARSPRRASLPSPLPALHLHHPRRAPGALPLSFAGSSLRQSYKQCFHRWWRWKQVLCVCVCACLCVCICAHALGRGRSALGGEVRGRLVISQKPDSSLCGRYKGTLRQHPFPLVTERMGSPCTWWT